MTDLWNYLKTATKPIVLYGIGNGADKVVKRLNDDNVKISGVFSSSGFKKNKTYNGHTIKDYSTIKNELGDFIILVCFGSHLPEVMQNVKNLAKENELYIPDVPVAGDEIFDREFAIKYKSKLMEVYNKLADEQSKKVFENTVKFKLTGRPEYLFEIESSKSEAFNILDLNANENFLDLGAYTGDTVAEFIQNCNSYDSIFAVEPDNRNFRKLLENTKFLNNVTCINAAVADKKGIQLMAANHGRGNSTSQKMVEVQTVCVDDICEQFSPTFIKMDIEGNELKAIEGGKKVIINTKPKMYIACYHTPFDLFEIPLKVLEYLPEYKLYMRHHPCFPAWDNNYIFKIKN